jgi:hypothetical protein
MESRTRPNIWGSRAFARRSPFRETLEYEAEFQYSIFGSLTSGITDLLDFRGVWKILRQVFTYFPNGKLESENVCFSSKFIKIPQNSSKYAKCIHFKSNITLYSMDENCWELDRIVGIYPNIHLLNCWECTEQKCCWKCITNCSYIYVHFSSFSYFCYVFCIWWLWGRKILIEQNFTFLRLYHMRYIRLLLFRISGQIISLWFSIWANIERNICIIMIHCQNKYCGFW